MKYLIQSPVFEWLGCENTNGVPIFKWWSEYWSINQMVIRIPNYPCTEHLNSEPFDKQIPMI